MEASSGSFAEERQPLDRKSSFREATRHAQERVVVENSFQELRSSLAAFSANNELLRKTLRNQDALWSLQRLDSIQSQNVELTRCIKSLYFSLSSRITYRLGYRVFEDLTKDVINAMQDFRSLLVELATQLQGDLNSQHCFLDNTSCKSCVVVEDNRMDSMEGNNGALAENNYSSPSSISFEELTDINERPLETDIEKRREILIRLLPNTESSLALIEEFLEDLKRHNFICFNTNMKWSQLMRCSLSACFIFVVVVTAGLIVFRPL